MSADSYLIAIISLIVITAILTLLILMRAEHERVTTLLIHKWSEGEIQWQAERQQLLDRIQAPSFDHLKQAEIRLVNAQKEEPPVRYELV